MNELIRYQIEARNPVTGYWEVHRECMCKYETDCVKRRFLWFTWYKSKITNKVEAEFRCRREIMVCRLAYEKEFKDVRVTKTEIACNDGHIYKDVVWENGVWKDC
jgi:hypothetical protein